MLAFFEAVLNSIQSIFDFILSFFTSFWELLKTVVKAVTFVTSLVGHLPVFVQSACLACLGITVIYLIINHGDS